jgi:hypothetical protein
MGSVAVAISLSQLRWQLSTVHSVTVVVAGSGVKKKTI